jgi:hypothetical protein
MNKRVLMMALVVLLAACAPISAEKVAATARPSGDTGESEQFWRTEARGQLSDALAGIDADCAAAKDCIMARLATAWPGTVDYQKHCQLTPAFVAAQCLIEYDFWATMGRKYYPSYRIRDAWASFNLTDNPTWREWATARIFECDPKMSKSQEFGDACLGDKAKRDLEIGYDATKGCYYDNPALASFCYWMAGFDVFAKEQIAMLKSGT